MAMTPIDDPSHVIAKVRELVHGEMLDPYEVKAIVGVDAMAQENLGVDEIDVANADAYLEQYR